jgi:hypothetical protein
VVAPTKKPPRNSPAAAFSKPTIVKEGIYLDERRLSAPETRSLKPETRKRVARATSGFWFLDFWF